MKKDSFLLEVIPGYKMAYFKWTGKITINQRLENIKRVNVFCEEKGIRHILVDLTEQINIGSPVELYNFGKVVAENMNNLIIAVVHGKNSDIEFLKNVAINRGAAIATFDDIKKAKEWLIKKITD